MTERRQRVAVLGASANPDRYSNRAVRALIEQGHEVIPVNPAESHIEGRAVVSDLGSIVDRVDTLTLYVSPKVSSGMADAIVHLNPGRVIFNPGTENPELQARLEVEGIPAETACTLVLLSTSQF